ncbi:MAG: S-adenosylmethionine decarboxylase [Clostridia bacterium]|nr:S-adenosylmethionine decarboxylase [Clostridia bacterium]
MYNYNKWITYDVTKEKEIIDRLENILVESGFKIVKKAEHYFEVQGYTALWLLSESHFAVHTFPEECKMYIEISSCVKEYYDKFVDKLKEIV